MLKYTRLYQIILNLSDVYIFQWLLDTFFSLFDHFCNFQNKKDTQRKMMPIRQIFTPWTPIWDHFVKKRIMYFLSIFCFCNRHHQLHNASRWRNMEIYCSGKRLHGQRKHALHEANSNYTPVQKLTSKLYQIISNYIKFE